MIGHSDYYADLADRSIQREQEEAGCRELEAMMRKARHAPLTLECPPPYGGREGDDPDFVVVWNGLEFEARYRDDPDGFEDAVGYHPDDTELAIADLVEHFPQEVLP